MHGIVSLLIKKIVVNNKLDLEKGHYINIEEQALSYIYVALVVLTKFDDDYIEKKSHPNSFDLSEWICSMQNVLVDFKKNLFGCDNYKAKSLSDLATMKYGVVNHRHILRTKPYISQYRRELIKTALRAPLTRYLLKSDVPENYEFHLFNICSKVEKNFRNTILNCYASEEKLKILSNSKFKSKKFKEFKINNLSIYNVSIYQTGIKSNTTEWLLDVFHNIALSDSLLKMYKVIDQIFNKIA